MLGLLETLVGVCIAVVQPGEGVLLSSPKLSSVEIGVGGWLNDDAFVDIPHEVGVYLCSVEIWFQPGYREGCRCSLEDEWEFKIRNPEKVFEWPDTISVPVDEIGLEKEE